MINDHGRIKKHSHFMTQFDLNAQKRFWTWETNLLDSCCTSYFASVTWADLLGVRWGLTPLKLAPATQRNLQFPEKIHPPRKVPFCQEKDQKKNFCLRRAFILSLLRKCLFWLIKCVIFHNFSPAAGCGYELNRH